MSSPSPIIPRSFDRSTLLCGFTTRAGGVSHPPFHSLNLGTRTGDHPESVRENYRILYSHLGVHDSQVALMRQVHSASVRIVDRGGVYDDTDGILSATPEILLGVRVADCVPVLLHDARKRVIGAIHCGWRPIVSEILEHSLETMRREWGVDSGDVAAVLGPSAGPCCYEIGREVAEQLGPGAVRERDGRMYADLHGEINRRLRSCGVKQDGIESIPHCTICNETAYFSHRRDALRSGRMMGYIMLRNGRADN